MGYTIWLARCYLCVQKIYIYIKNSCSQKLFIAILWQYSTQCMNKQVNISWQTVHTVKVSVIFLRKKHWEETILFIQGMCPLQKHAKSICYSRWHCSGCICSHDSNAHNDVTCLYYWLRMRATHKLKSCCSTEHELQNVPKVIKVAENVAYECRNKTLRYLHKCSIKITWS